VVIVLRYCTPYGFWYGVRKFCIALYGKYTNSPLVYSVVQEAIMLTST
jgi:hypothetical protein